MGIGIPPPQDPLRWDHTPESVLALTKEAIEVSRALEDKVAALEESECNFSTVFLPLALDDAELGIKTSSLLFYQKVATDKALRDASTEAKKMVSDYGIESSMRIDVYNALLNAQKKGEKLSPEEQKLVDKMILDGKRAGLGLPEDKREELKKLKKELSVICTDFGRNFNEEKGTIALTREELKGVPEDVLKGYTAVEGTDKLAVTFKKPDIFPLFKYAENPETRKRAYIAFENRLEINKPLFTRAIELRRQCAAILGYKNWADYVEETKMIKTADEVVKFLADLQEKIQPVGSKDRDALLKLKEKVHAKLNLPHDGEFYSWDYQYYDRLHIEESLSLDDSLVKEYFPVDVVVPTILEIYQNLLGVKFEEVKGSLWHPDAQQFAVWEANAKDEKDFLGWAYLDLFPRESKYPHAAVSPLLPGYTTREGGRFYPTAAMVANVAKPTPGRPALMRHDDVVTFFHEMGHVFHALLSKTRFARFHGTRVARDFVEAPSQMLENWCWEPEVLKKMSSHYERKEPLTDELIQKLVDSRYVNIGLYFLRQIFFGTFDIQVHTQDVNEQAEVDYSTLWSTLREKIAFSNSGGLITHGQSAFNHLMGGYDAGYYSYAYSLVFAADMCRTVFEGAPLDPDRGKLYRDKILRPGASRDELESLKDFLGREPNSDAFLENLLGKPK